MARRYETLADQNDYDYEEDDDGYIPAWADTAIPGMGRPGFAPPGRAYMPGYHYPGFTDDVMMD
jgi:hypothetical protein